MSNELRKTEDVTQVQNSGGVIQDRVEMFSEIERTFAAMRGTVQSARADLQRLFTE